MGNQHQPPRKKTPNELVQVDSLCGARGESGESDAARRIKTEFLAQCCWRCFLKKTSISVVFGCCRFLAYPLVGLLCFFLSFLSDLFGTNAGICRS